MVSTSHVGQFATPRATQIVRIIQKRRPLAEKIESVEKNLKALAAALYKLEQQREILLAQVEDSSTVGRLKEINCSVLHQQIGSELVELKKLKARFSRNNLNIGVVGKAKQGKSRLLQSLTGLSAAEIPDGSDQHCTGVRSNIHHNPDVETSGEVWFHTERSFLDEVIAPYYQQLHLGSRPYSIDQFKESTLPALPQLLAGQALAAAKYEHLLKYHQNLHKYCELLSTPSPRRISQHEIREYVAQDTLDGRRIYFNYLAVREVKIVCSFPHQDMGQIALVDMPGLGDTGIGDAERMIKTLGQDIDIVLFVRMPKSTGDFWSAEDVELYDMANSALIALPIKEWSFMVLNHVDSSSGGGNNRRNCESLAADIADKHINVQETIIANCANSESVQTEILDRVLDYLTQRIEVLDRQYASVCQERLIELQKMVQAELDKSKTAWKASRNLVLPSEFVDLFDKLWKELTGELARLISSSNPSSMISARDTDDQNFKSAVETAIADCRANPEIPSLEEIETKHHLYGSYDSAYAKCLHEVRTQLSKRFLSLDDALKESLEETKSRVVEILTTSGRLRTLADGNGSEFLQNLTEVIPENLVGLRLGFHTLATFNLEYRGLIQHRIRKYLDVLTPDRTPYNLDSNFFDISLDLKKGKISSNLPKVEKILSNLQKAHKEAVDNCEKELKTIFKEPSQAGFAIVEEFVDRVLRVEGIENEWQIFLLEFASDVWPQEFGSIMANGQHQRDWMQVIEKADQTNKPEALHFLR